MTNASQPRKRSLRTLLTSVVAGLLLLLLIGNFALNILVSRNYLQNQLQSHAQDAATSLGLSLSTVIDARDKVRAARMIDAIFDSGDYRRVTYRDNQGEALIERRSAVEIASVPAWFVSLIELQTPVQEAQVMSGWSQLGSLEVQSHPGYAYLELWHAAQTQLSWFGIVVVIAAFLIHLIMSFILAPLHRVERQAQEMANKNFDYRAPVPTTRELSQVAMAMNEMADRLGQVFSEQLLLIENLREQSLMDNLTGLNNREGFDARLKSELESRESIPHGTLFLIKINDFDSVNRLHGRAEGDDLLRVVGDELRKLVRSHVGSFAARRSGADFSVFFPTVAGDGADDIAQNLAAKLSSLPMIKQLLREDLVHVGVACVTEEDDRKSLLSKADLALTQAQGKGVSGWQRYAYFAADDVLKEVRQAGEWLGVLQEVLTKQAVELHLQPMYDASGRKKMHEQVLARIEVDQQLVVAGVFLPMVERFQLMVPFDQMIVEKVLNGISGHASTSDCYSISLSEAAIGDDAFITWFGRQLSSRPDIAKRLLFEVPEHVVNHSEASLARLCRLARQYGFRVSVERFGASSVPFSYLQRVDVDAIKVDHSFVRDIHENPANQFFLRSAVQIAHSQAIRIFAVGVESELEWQTLCALGIDGAMGYHLGRPEKTAIF